MDLYNKIENLRSKKQSLTIIVGFSCVFMVLLFVRVTIISLILMPVIIGGIKKIKAYNREIQKTYKDEFLYGILKEYFEDVVINWEHGFNREDVERIGLARMGNRFYSEDLISATYDGVCFRQSEVRIEDEHGSGDDKTIVTYFKGRMFSFEYDIKDIVSTMIYSKNYAIEGKGLGLKYGKVEMESTEFNRDFNVKSARDIDAFYVLTPQMMEFITALKQRYGNIAVHFTPKRVYVAYNSNKNAFDLDTRKRLDLGLEREKRAKDIEVIIDIIKTLKITNERRSE